METEIRRVPAAATRPLRRRILRPHQSADELDYRGDGDLETFHVAALAGDEVIATASLYRQGHPELEDTFAWRLRGMAVAENRRGQGLGARLLEACLLHVAAEGNEGVWCNARSSARSFYERFGFECVGDEFEPEGLGPHRLMIRPPSERSAWRSRAVSEGVGSGAR